MVRHSKLQGKAQLSGDSTEDRKSLHVGVKRGVEGSSPKHVVCFLYYNLDYLGVGFRRASHRQHFTKGFASQNAKTGLLVTFFLAGIGSLKTF